MLIGKPLAKLNALNERNLVFWINLPLLNDCGAAWLLIAFIGFGGYYYYYHYYYYYYYYYLIFVFL